MFCSLRYMASKHNYLLFCVIIFAPFYLSKVFGNMSDIIIESGAQAYTRLLSQLRPSLSRLSKDIFPDKGPHSKKIIEIIGETGSGKSILAMEIMARAILPYNFGGCDSEAVFFDLDHKFCPFQFSKILEKVAKNYGENRNHTEMEAAVLNSAENLHIFKCYSPDEYELAFTPLDDILFKNKNVSLIAVDSISAFYWLDTSNKQIKMESHYRKLVGKLKKVCIEYGIVGMFTRPCYYANKDSGKGLVDYKFELVSCGYGIKAVELKVDASEETFNKLMVIDDFGINYFA